MVILNGNTLNVTLSVGSFNFVFREKRFSRKAVFETNGYAGSTVLLTFWFFEKNGFRDKRFSRRPIGTKAESVFHQIPGRIQEGLRANAGRLSGRTAHIIKVHFGALPTEFRFFDALGDALRQRRTTRARRTRNRKTQSLHPRPTGRRKNDATQVGANARP